MIGWLCGKIIDKPTIGKMILDVKGVGYEVETSFQTFSKLEFSTDDISLYIHTVVREDAFLLYGFADKIERDVFKLLIKTSGVGPKLALTILSHITPDDLCQTIVADNALSLSKLPGIGKKTAERLIIELKDKIGQLSMAKTNAMLDDTTHASNTANHQAAMSALEALGYKYQDAAKVFKHIDKHDKSCEQLIKEALKLLAK